MAEVSEVHVRVNGWCDTCGGIGRQAVEHEDRRRPGDLNQVVAWLVMDLRQAATIMEPSAAFDYRVLANHIERILVGVGEGVEGTDRFAHLAALDLTDGERRFLAMHARYESNHQDDWRYQHKDPVERARLKARWRLIADTFHTDPWGTGS